MIPKRFIGRRISVKRDLRNYKLSSGFAEEQAKQAAIQQELTRKKRINEKLAFFEYKKKNGKELSFSDKIELEYIDFLMTKYDV